MNGIIGLCHFCELHGPSILFCTQAFHSQYPDPFLSASVCKDDYKLQFTQPSLQRSQSTGSLNQIHNSVVSVLERSTADSEPSLRNNAAKSPELCEACRSFKPGHPGLISNDLMCGVSYVSCQKPANPQVYTMLRQACVRSLSCEVCPGREGPMFFGDEHRGHVLSHTFYLQDTHARGGQRWYSIVVVMMDKIFLLNSWPFLVQKFRSVIDDLQAKAHKVFEKEEASCPMRKQRLVQGMTPSNFHQQRGTNKQARSLPELTNDKQIFTKLHLVFTCILKAGGTRLTEKLLEGPPTEDSVIDMEKNEETEDGFVLLYSGKEGHTDTDPNSHSAEPQPHRSTLRVPTQDVNCDCGMEELQEEDGENEPVFTSLRHLLKVLGAYKFHELAHHVVIGNQIVIRSHMRSTIKSIIDNLKLLLPKGCCRSIYYSERYEDSWRCNFLGLEPGVALPPHIDLYVTLDVLDPEPKEITASLDSPCSMQKTDSCDFPGYTFMLNSPQTLPEKGPTVLAKIELALLNENLADSVVEQCLICLKEEWMNKVKVLFKFTKAGGSRSEDETSKLLKVVGAQSEDKAVLKFWMTGLSVQYRNHMLSSAIGQSSR